MRLVPRRLLLFAATTGYQIRVFADAARRLGVDLTLATDRCHVLEDPWGDHATPVKFDRIEESVDALRSVRCDGIAAVGDRPAVLAAAVAEELGVPFHPLSAARACNDKFLARQLYQAAGMLVPQFFRANLEEDPGTVAARAPYPCVLKPLGLSASQGVIRADDEREFVAAFERIRKMGQLQIQVESYIEGREFAVEGLVTNGSFFPLSVFDKPDPLEGPFFEESIYVTPSRAPRQAQQDVLAATVDAVHALGLRYGPVHVELRHNSKGAWIIETAARPIGGLCAKALRFEPDVPFEELILRHALGEDVTHARSITPASGVMMIPVPKAGIYQSVEGVEKARAIPGIEEVIITAKEGQRLVPWPEGASYPGFIFARGNTAEEVEAALRRAHAELRFHVATALETFKPSS